MQALVAFDLDGVLYTSEAFLGAAYREAIAKVNARRPGSFPRVPSAREIVDHVGWPVLVILERLFPRIERTAVDLLAAESLGVICAHVERGEGQLFPGVVATLERLRGSGFLLAVASNGRRPYVEAVLRAHQLTPYFVDLITIDQAPAVTEKADVLRSYLARHSLVVEQLVMVGDRASDVTAAAAIDCRFIGCDYGHGHRSEIEDAGPLVSSFDQLLRVVPDVLAAVPMLPNGVARS